MRTKVCPFCQKYDYTKSWHGEIARHVADCSKKYIDSLYLMETISYVNKVKMPERRVGSMGRRRVNEDRRKNNRTLWYFVKDSPIKRYSGSYIDESFDVQADRRQVLGPHTRRIKPRRRCDR